jgi:hypothetical protein
MIPTEEVSTTVESNNSLSNKHGHLVSDFETDLEEIKRLYLKAVNSRDFWSGPEKIVFADSWTCLMRRLISCGITFHGLKHRLVLDEEKANQEQEEIY